MNIFFPLTLAILYPLATLSLPCIAQNEKMVENIAKPRQINATAVSPARSCLATCDSNGLVIIHQLDAGETVQCEIQLPSRAKGLQFTDDGSALALAYGHEIALFDARSGEKMKTLLQLKEDETIDSFFIQWQPKLSIAFVYSSPLPPQPTVEGVSISARDPYFIQVNDGENGKVLYQDEIEGAMRIPFTFTTDGHSLLRISDDGEIIQIDLEKGTERILAEEVAHSFLKYTEEGNIIAHDYDDKLAMYDAEGKKLFSSSQSSMYFDAKEILSKPPFCLASEDDGHIVLFDRESKKEYTDLAAKIGNQQAVTLSPCGRYIAAIKKGEGIVIMDVSSAATLATIPYTASHEFLSFVTRENETYLLYFDKMGDKVKSFALSVIEL